MTLPGTDVAVTVSIGVAVFPDHASTPDRLERLADAALYVAKRQGRNRVELAEPTPANASVPDQRGATGSPSTAPSLEFANGVFRLLEPDARIQLPVAFDGLDFPGLA